MFFWLLFPPNSTPFCWHSNSGGHPARRAWLNVSVGQGSMCSFIYLKGHVLTVPNYKEFPFVACDIAQATIILFLKVFKPGIDFDSLWIKVLSSIYFQNRRSFPFWIFSMQSDHLAFPRITHLSSYQLWHSHHLLVYYIVNKDSGIIETT